MQSILSNSYPTAHPQIRRASGSDLQAVAALWRASLLEQGFTHHGLKYDPSRAATLQQNVADQLLRQQERKLEATRMAHELQQSHAMTSPKALATSYSNGLFSFLQQRKQRQAQSKHNTEQLKLRHRRMWACLVADPGSSSSQQLAGYVLVSMTQPLAALPPPFPSGSPWCLHIDGLAVSGEHRRRGLGTRLLRAAERLAVLWGRKSLWLHVDVHNLPAVQLYSSLGYRVACKVGWPFREKLVMYKMLQSPAARDTGARALISAVVGSAHKKGVFVWTSDMDQGAGRQ